MKKVSIIVPVYNTKEDYLKECLNSLVNQTIKEDIEIIVIDDGSTNIDCIKVCDEYAEKYTNLKVIHQKNQGQGVTRNIGMSIATGKWVMFIDSDDWVENNICEKLLENVEDDVDIVISSCNICYKNKIVPINMFDGKDQELKEKEKLELQPMSKLILENDKFDAVFLMICWAKLYRRDFLLKNKLNEVTKTKYMEDFIVNLYCFEYAKKIIYKNYCLYNYRQRKNSTLHSDKIERVEDYLKYIEAEEKFIKDFNKPEIFWKAHKIRTVSSIVAVINKNVFTPKVKYKKSKQVVEKLVQKEKINDYLYNVELKYFTSYEKICIILLKKRMYLLFYLVSFVRYNIKSLEKKGKYYDE